MKRFFLILSIILTLSSSCKNKEEKAGENLNVVKKNYHHIEQLKWLIGNWTNITPEQQSYESWVQKNDSTLTAYSYTIVLNDTVFQENISVQQNSGTTILVINVPNQNEEKSVTFKLLPIKKDVFTFVNKQHDFPNKISYTNPAKDSIHAWIEGEVDSTYKKIDFYFKRGNQ